MRSLAIKHTLFLASLIAGFLFGSTQNLKAQIDRDFADMLNGILKNSVPLVSVSRLSNLIENDKEFYLLDTREPAEFAVSYIQTAINVGFDDFSLDLVSHIPKDAQIIVYCSLGYRSEKIGEILLAAGYTNVTNLQGGIFNWLNQGYHVLNQKGQITYKVHPYNRWWGRWVFDADKTYEP
jgi:rhodanese-related sulfurtransferase